jgi:hypothetical protein
MHEPPLELWFWIVTDEVTKRRRQTRYRMTQSDALERFGADASENRRIARGASPHQRSHERLPQARKRFARSSLTEA